MVHRMECTVAWNNVAGLMNISHKLCVPALQKECRTFLLTHAAGKPIKAMRIAELYQEEELYRESSRLNTLSQETLLKLEKRYVCCPPNDLTHCIKSVSSKNRRNWFLERVLKLGLTMISKEYQCVSSLMMMSACRAYQGVFLVSYLS
jgi:hypothetical protein